MILAFDIIAFACIAPLTVSWALEVEELRAEGREVDAPVQLVSFTKTLLPSRMNMTLNN